MSGWDCSLRCPPNAKTCIQHWTLSCCWLCCWAPSDSVGISRSPCIHFSSTLVLGPHVSTWNFNSRKGKNVNLIINCVGENPLRWKSCFLGASEEFPYDWHVHCSSTGMSIHPALREYLVSEEFIVWEGITSLSCHHLRTKHQQSQGKHAYEK